MSVFLMITWLRMCHDMLTNEKQVVSFGMQVGADWLNNELDDEPESIFLDSPYTLATIVEEYYIEERLVPQKWGNYRVFECIHKCMSVCERSSRKNSFHNWLWEKHSVTFDDACFIVPIINIEAVLCYKWAALAIGIITKMQTDAIPIIREHNVIFQLLYYKACLTHQILYKPVQDHDVYSSIYNKIMELGIKEEYYIPDFEQLHDWPRKKHLDKYEKDVRLAIISLCKMLAHFGLELVVPFSIATPRINKNL